MLDLLFYSARIPGALFDIEKRPMARRIRTDFHNGYRTKFC